MSHVLRVPGAGLGLAVLTNQESDDAYQAVIHHVADHVLQAPRSDWLAAFRAARALERIHGFEVAPQGRVRAGAVEDGLLGRAS